MESSTLPRLTLVVDGEIHQVDSPPARHSSLFLPLFSATLSPPPLHPVIVSRASPALALPLTLPLTPSPQTRAGGIFFLSPPPSVLTLASPRLPPVATFFFLSLELIFHEKGRASTNPILSINDLSVDNNFGETVSASATPHLPSHGQALAAHIQAPGSCRRSPLASSDGPSPCVPFLPPL